MKKREAMAGALDLSSESSTEPNRPPYFWDNKLEKLAKIIKADIEKSERENGSDK